MSKRSVSSAPGDYNAGFLKASRDGNLEKLIEFLNLNVNINVTNANGLTALHLAAKEGHDHVVSELIRRRANLSSATRKGNTALHVASLGGHEAVARLLVENGAEVNARSQEGFTPLYMATQENHVEVVKYLLEQNADHTIFTPDGYTPLAVALQMGYDDVVGVLMDHESVMQTKSRLPALHRAAKRDDFQGAASIIRKEADKDLSAKLVVSLVNEITKSGFTPLHIASHYGSVKVARLLLDNGADINFKARNLVTPLHVASKWGRTNVVQLLLDNGARIDCLTKDELTPLHCASRSGHDNVVRMLLSRGAVVNCKSKSRLSPLHMSAQGDHPECAQLVLNNNAPIDDVTIDYLTPLHVTAHCGNVKTCKLLLDNKCEINARALNGFTPLHVACKKNRIKIVELLLRYGAVIESTTETGLTPLHVASFMGHMAIVKLLLENGANPQSANDRGETALHLAARGDQTEIMELLLDSGVPVDVKAKELQTALHIAARQGNLEGVDLLLKRGASPNAATKDLYTPLHIAVREGHEDVAKLLLDNDANPTLTTKKGFTPLHVAAKHGHLKVAQLLLQRGVDPNIKGRNDLTPLHVATHYGHPSIASYLLNKGANPVSTTKNGYTPLHIAAKKNQLEIAATLLQRGARPGSESRNGFTPLHLAAKEGHVQMVKLLFDRGADANCRAKNGLTPMHLAAQEDHVPVAELLVKHDAEIDPQTKAGYTPLHTACHFGQINMIQFLLEHGAPVNAATKLGFTPLHQAAQQGHVMVINLLLRYHANPNAVNAAGQTPLSISQRLGYLSVVEILQRITEVIVPPSVMVGRYKPVGPETMQDAGIFELDDIKVLKSRRPGSKRISGGHLPYDGDDEPSLNGTWGGADSVPTGAYPYLSTEDGGQPGSASPSYRDDSDVFGFDRTLDRFGSVNFSSDFHALEDEMKYMREPMISVQDEFAEQYAGTMPIAMARQSKSRAPPPDQLEKNPEQYAKRPESKTMVPTLRKRPTMESVPEDKEPPGFLCSFVVDPRGGISEGGKPAGVRIIVPPDSVSMPTRISCKLVPLEKVSHPPVLQETEALATWVLEMGPVGAEFKRPILIEVPHFASLREHEREITVVRSENGRTWQEHFVPPGTDEAALLAVLQATFEGVEPSDELYKKRVHRLLTTEFPQYFAIVTRVTRDTETLGIHGGAVHSTRSPRVKVVVPSGSLTKNAHIGLQVQPVPEDLIAKRLGSRPMTSSPIVTVEPRRRKFYKPITLTLPLPRKVMDRQLQHSDMPTLRLLRSTTDGLEPAEWEDVTGSTPLTVNDEVASFASPVAGSFWLVDSPNVNDSQRLVSELYPDVIVVPFMAKFVVCGRRHLPTEARLRVFCMTGDILEKTVRSQYSYEELARSREVEVLMKTPQYIEMDGNLVIISKTKKQPYIFFRPFKPNRITLRIKIRDLYTDPTGHLSFMHDPKYPRGRSLQAPICALNITLPVDVTPDTEGDSTEDGISKDEDIQSSDLESEPDSIGGDRLDRFDHFKRQEPGIAEIILPSAPVKIDFNPDNMSYDTFAAQTDDKPRTLTKPKPAKEVKRTEGDIISRSETVEDQEGLDGGRRTRKRKLVTTKHFKPIFETTYVDGRQTDQVSHEELVGADLDENILELPSGVIEPYAANCDTSIRLDDSEVPFQEGIKAKKALLTVSVSRKPEKPDGRSRIVEGPIETSKETKQATGTLNNGGIFRHKVVTATSVNPIHEVTTSADGLETSRLIRKDLVGIDVVETVLELPPGVAEANAKNVKTETTIANSEESLPNGKVAKKTLIKTVATLSNESTGYGEIKPIPAQRKGKSTPYKSPEDGNEVIHRNLEGEIEPKVTVEEDESELDDGVIRKRKVVTTKYVKPTYTVRIVDGSPPEFEKHEETVDADVKENILELDYGVVEPYAANCDTNIAVTHSKTTLPEGIIAKKKTTTMKVKLPRSAKEGLLLPESRTGQLPRTTKKVIEGDLIHRPVIAEDKQDLNDGGTIRRRITTTKHIKPFTEITVTNGVPTETRKWEELTGTDVEENILQLPAGVVEPNSSNCDIDVTVDKSKVTLPDGNPANKTITRTTVRLRDPVKPPRKKLKKHIRRPGAKGVPKETELEPGLEEGPIESRKDVKEYEVTRNDGGKTKYRILTTTNVRSILEVTKVSGVERRRKLREELVSKEIDENILELPPGVTDVNRSDVKTDTTVNRSEETLPDGTPVKKTVVRTVATLLSKWETRDDKPEDASHKVIEGEIEPRTEIEEDETNLDDGTTIRDQVITTKYVKPITEVKLVPGQPPESTTREEIVDAEIEENILELPCGIIEPHGKNCDTDISVADSVVNLPENVPARKKTTKTVVKLKPTAEDVKGKVTKKLIEGDVIHRPDIVEDKQDLNDGGTIRRKVTTTKHLKPFTEITSTNGIPTDTRKWEELIGTDIEENILQLPAGVIEPNSSNCDIDVTVDKSKVTLPDGNPASKTITKTTVHLRDPFKPPRKKLRKHKRKPGIKGVPKEATELEPGVIEGPIESRKDVKEYDVRRSDGGITKHRVITTTNVRSIIEMKKTGGAEKRRKLREELVCTEIEENILELPPGVMDVNRKDVKTDTTVERSEDTLPDGTPVKKTIVRTIGTLLHKFEIRDREPEDSSHKVIEGEIEPRKEIEEDEQNLDDGTTVRDQVITTRYVKPITEVKLVPGHPPESTTREEIVDAEVEENILELPCGIIEPHGENCDTDVSVTNSVVNLPENVPARKKSTKTVVKLKPSPGDPNKRLPKVTKQLIEGEVVSRFMMAEENEELPDGGTLSRKLVTTKHVRPFTEIINTDGIPTNTRHWEELIGTDIEEHVLQLPAGVIEPNSSNCDIDITVDKSKITLPDGCPANKTVTKTIVHLRDPTKPPRKKLKKQKRTPGAKAVPKETELEPGLIESPIEARKDVKEYEVRRNDGGITKHKVITTTNVKSILEVTRAGGVERRRKLREELVSKEIDENILELPHGVADVINRNDVKTNTTVDRSDETSPDGTPVKKTVVRTTATLLSKSEISDKKSGDTSLQVIEGEIEPRTEIEEDEKNLDDGTTIRDQVITTRYVKPITEVKLVAGHPPESTTREEIVDAEVEENILELPCGIIDPLASNCEKDITVQNSKITLPEGTPARKKTTKVAVLLRPSTVANKEDGKTPVKKERVPKVTRVVIEGDIESRTETHESQKNLESGGSITHRITTTKRVKPITEVTSTDGVPTEEKHHEEIVGTDIEENILLLPVGIIEPNSSNCDIDISVDKSKVTLPDGSPANKTVTKTTVHLRDRFKPPRKKLKKHKKKPGIKGVPTEAKELEPGVIEGPIESRRDVKEYEVKRNDGGVTQYCVITTTNIRSILEVMRAGGVERKRKLREELISKEIDENILELPPGITDINRKEVKTDTTVARSEETLPDGTPVKKTVVKTIATLLPTWETSSKKPDDVTYQVIEGEIEPRTEIEEDEENLNDGTTIREQVTTTRYVKPVTEVKLVQGHPPESTTKEEIVDAEVEENILELPCGVIEPDAGNCDKKTSVQTSEVVLPDGTPAKKKTTRITVILKPPVSEKEKSLLASKYPDLTREILVGDIECRSVEAEDKEDLQDGGIVKRKIVTTTHIKPITVITRKDGVVFETKRREEIVGTDIEEHVLKLPSGYIERNADNCETDISLDNFEITLSDGRLARKTLLTTVVTLKKLPGKEKLPAKKLPEKEKLPVYLFGKKLQPNVLSEVESLSSDIILSPIQSKSETTEYQENTSTGGISLHRVTSTTHSVQVLKVTIVRGEEKKSLLREQIVGKEITENILDLPPGVAEPNRKDIETNTTVNKSEELLPNGAAVRKTVVKTVATLIPKPSMTVPEIPRVTYRVIEGEVEPRSDTVEGQENLDDGKSIKRKVITTTYVKPITVVKLANGIPPDSKTREETVAVDVKENILELPCGLIEPNAKNCDIGIAVNKSDDVTPENVPTKTKTTKMTVQLKPAEKYPDITRNVLEGEIEARSTVEQDQRDLDDGAVVKRKIITTRYIKPITEITNKNGVPIETTHREELVRTDIEENILQLPAGLIEPNAANCESDMSVNTTEVTLPDGNLAKKTTVKIVVRLKDGTEWGPLKVESDDAALIPGRQGEQRQIVEGDVIIRTDVKEDEVKSKENVTTKRKIVTKTHVKPIRLIITFGGQKKETQLREEIVKVEIVENILKLPSGVTDPNGKNVRTESTFKTSTDTLQNGAPVIKETVLTVASLSTDEPEKEMKPVGPFSEEISEIPNTTKKIIEGPIKAKSDVSEDQKNFNDGRTLKEKTITTRFFKPVTEITLHKFSPPESQVTEELVRGEVKQVILDLPCGKIEPFASNCDTDISVVNMDATLPENIVAPKKVTRMTVHLKQPEGKQPSDGEKSKVTHKTIEGEITSKSTKAEDDDTLDDGTVKKREVITTQFMKPITEITLVDNVQVDLQTRDELVETVVDETVVQLSPGVIEPDASNCETDISFENTKFTLPDGTPGKKRLVKIFVRIKDAPLVPKDPKLPTTKIVEGPVELRTKVYKDEKKLEDGATVRRKVITTRHIKPIMEVTIVNGKETDSRLREEKLVLTEIEENILQIPPGLKDVYGKNVDKKSTIQKFEEKSSDGSPIKRNVIKTIVSFSGKPEGSWLPLEEDSSLEPGSVPGRPSATKKVIEGPIDSRTTEKEDVKSLEHGIRKEKTVTTTYFKPITEITLLEGSAPDSQTREVVVRTEIDECILVLPAGVIKPFARNCDTTIKVDNFEYSLPDGSPVAKKIVLMTVRLKKGLLPSDETEGVKPRGVSTQSVEGEIEARTQVTEEQDKLSSGGTLKRKNITTKYVQPVTDIIFNDGVESSRNCREVIVGVDKEEHILELPSGVIEPYASNCETDILVTKSKEMLPDGILANKKVVKITVILKPTSAVSKTKESLKGKIPSKKVVEGPIQSHVNVEEKQDRKPDGSKEKSKITTTQFVKPITTITSVDGIEIDRSVEEVLVSKEIVVDVLELRPGVTEPYSDTNTESSTTVKHFDEVSPDDGTPVKRKLTTTVVSPRGFTRKEPVRQEVSHETRKGDVWPQTTVTEDEKNLEDGSSIRKKVITTLYVMPVTELTLVNGIETEASTKDNIVSADIEEHILQLPAGLIEPYADNCDIDISVRNSDEKLPDGAPAKKKVVTTVVNLRESDKLSQETRKTIDGEIRTTQDVKEDERVLNNGTIIRSKTITTRWVKTVTEVLMVGGNEVKSQSRDVIVATEIDENILEIPPTVKDQDRSEKQISVENDEVTLPDGTIAKRKVTRTVLSEKRPSVTHTVLEGAIESRKTETQDQRNLDDGTTVRSKVITTKHVKQITDITVVDGTPTESQAREETVGIDIEEHILHLPPGVIEPFGSNCDTDISVENSEEPTSEGVIAKKKVVTMTVSLKEAQKPDTKHVTAKKVELTMELPPDSRMNVPENAMLKTHLSEGLVEKPVEVRKKVTEDQKNLEDGSTIRRKVIRIEYVRPIVKIDLVDGFEKETFVREELLDVEIEEHILQLPPGVIEPFGSNCQTEISVESSEVMLPEIGRMAKTKIVKMMVYLKAAEKPLPSPIEEKLVVDEPANRLPNVTHNIIEGKIDSMVKVTESQQILDDGSTIRKKVITTKFIKPVTDITLVDGVEVATETREENIRTEIEEITLKLPAGVIEMYGSNLETDTTVDQFDCTLDDGTPAKKKLVTIVVRLKNPVQDETTTRRSTSQIDGPDSGAQKKVEPSVVHKVVEGNLSISTDVVEDESSKPDGTTVRRRIFTKRHFKPVTNLTIVDGSVTDAVTDEKTVKTEIDETIVQLPPGVKDPNAPNLNTETKIEHFQETLPDGRQESRKVTTKTFTVQPTREISVDSKVQEMTSTRIEEQRLTQTGTTQYKHPEVTRTISGPPPDSDHTRPSPEKKPETERLLQKKRRDRSKIHVEDKSPETADRNRKRSKESVKTVKKRVKTTIRRIGPDGEVFEDVFTEEEDLSDVPSPTGSKQDLHDLSSPTFLSPSDSDSDKPSSIKVYTDTVESEPVIERQVQEFEDTLPDGTLVKRRLIKTTQKKTIIKRVVMEGPDDELAVTGDEQVRQMLHHRPSSTEPQLTKYTDVAKQEPQTETDFQEFEETLPDGTVVKKRVKTTTQQQLTTERTVLGGKLDDTTLQEIFKDDGKTKAIHLGSPSPSAQRRSAPRGPPDVKEHSSRLLLKRQIHLRTVIEPGREETVIVDETHLDHENDTPEELKETAREAVRQYIEQRSGSSADDESSTDEESL